MPIDLVLNHIIIYYFWSTFLLIIESKWLFSLSTMYWPKW